MSEFDETVVLAEEPATRNPVVLILAVVGALLAGVLVWFFVAAPLLQGDDVEDVAVAPSAAPADSSADSVPAPTEADAEPVEAEPAVLPVVTYEVFLDRDPFEPVVPEPTSATADTTVDPVDGVDGAVTDGTAGGTTDGTAGDGSSDGTTDTTGGTTAGCTSSGDEELVCDGRVVSLVDVRTGDDGELLAVIQVDTTLYEVRSGETFAGSFRVQSISSEGVYLLYGDDAFSLEEGERVLK